MTMFRINWYVGRFFGRALRYLMKITLTNQFSTTVNVIITARGTALEISAATRFIS